MLSRFFHSGNLVKRTLRLCELCERYSFAVRYDLFPGGFLRPCFRLFHVFLPVKYNLFSFKLQCSPHCPPVTVCVLHVCMGEKSEAGGDTVSPHLYDE